ncbi:MAG: AAA domain-containing protein, partial [Clostridia bacterium]|nr:AAA domain-containing protein [Clostridia bacterium]
HLSAAWFDPRKNEEIRTLCGEAAACAKTMLEKKAAVLADWEPAALDIDTDAILARFKTEYVGMLRKLKSGYKEDMKTLRLHAKAVGAALDEQKVIAFLQDAKEIKTCRAWFESHETALREAIGADYRGAETPWEKILTGLTAAARIKELFPYGMISGETMEAIAAVPYSMDYSGLARRAADTLQPARIEEELAHAAVWCSDYTDNLSVSQKLCPMLSGHLEQLKARRGSLDAFRASQKDGILRYQDINNLLSDLALIRMESSWFERNDTDNRTLLGPEYPGRESEWKKLHDGLFAAGELTILFDGTVPQALIAYACSENHAELPNAVLALDETAVRELSDEIAAFPGYPYEEEQSFSADLLPAFRTCLQAAETISDVLTLVRPYLAVAVDPGLIAGSIRTAAEVKSERDSITARAEQLTAMFGVRYNGTETDWQGLLEDLDVIDTFLDTEGSAVNEYFLHTLGTATSSMRAQLNEKLDRVKELLSGTNDRLAAFEAQFEGTDFRSQSIASAAARYDACLDGFDALNHWLDYMETRADCDKLGLSAFTAAVDEKDNTIADVTAAFERAFAAEWIEAVIENVPAVQKFRRRVHEDRIARFHTLDNSQFALSSKRIREKFIETFPDLETVEKSSSQLGILRHEMDKKRRYMPLRRLFAAIPDLLLTLKPCLMMSPLSVAYFLEAGAYQFDMVIFDEASQIFPQDAIGAIFRGKQVIIAGDTKQLPPTSFFSSSTGNSDTDADENEDTFDEEVYDSILEETAGLLPNRTLLWHYRSRHEHLIAYSNHEIYKNELVTFPSCVERAPDVGVEFIYVEDGYYESNGRNCNLPEAKRIVELVKEHIDLHPDRSLGIIAFSEKQQNAINLDIVRFRKRTTDYGAFFAEGKEDDFFVKNLVAGQGDERDTSLFSVGYAKTKEQKAKDQPMSMRFGPLGIQGGERRLNVAITRAKINIKLVSSILPSDIDLTRTESEGIRMLRGYLEFAKNGEVSLGAQKKNVRRDEFAESVADFLREAGYHVKQYVGCSGYKIDIAVEDEESHRFIAGIECDGYSYTSARTARDRDRLRSSVLHSMGWNLYRMWSSEWYKNPELEGKKLITFIEKSKEANAEKEKAEAEERAASEKARQAAEEEKAQELARKKAAAEAAERKRIAEEARKEAERIAAKEAKRLAANEKRRAERAAKREAMKAAEPAAHEAEPMSAPEPEKSAPKKKMQKRTHTDNPYDWVVPGAHITHSAYGDGVIEEVHDAYLTASFSDGVKKFQNPGALESGFIKKAGENE